MIALYTFTAPSECKNRELHYVGSIAAPRHFNTSSLTVHMRTYTSAAAAVATTHDVLGDNFITTAAIAGDDDTTITAATITAVAFIFSVSVADVYAQHDQRGTNVSLRAELLMQN